MSSQSAATIRSRYVEQAASDLEDNRRRQEQLTEELRVLQQEESLLTDILSLTQGFAPSLPEQAREREPDVGTGRRTRAVGGQRARVVKPAKRKSPSPLVSDLLAGLLDASSEPRAAKDLRAELMAKHPERSPTPQVVRNTLESLVAKGRLRRHKEERSVLYTLVRPQQP
ncbi:hypothetical protein [Streptomyces sp. NRRL F-5630]|uniref:hypothetical protein n=1 Tax=Streptomyces sp. NRRL F-5630 TaxID=1463864 RepID=UPI003EBBF14B